MNYLNERDPVAAAWLKELRDAGLIPPCDIDTRSIEDVTPAELRGYTQCHFFAGIGGWPLALQFAGWRADRRIWTGSCPCQPFSTSGKGDGFADERHLWPAWFWLIEQCRPDLVVGEQVASGAAGPWLDLVLTDLEALGYSGGAYAGPAAGVGAPHIRDRGYWFGLANADRNVGRQGRSDLRGRPERSPAQSRPGPGGGGVLDGLAYPWSDSRRAQAASPGQPQTDRSADQHGGHCVPPVRLADGYGDGRQQGREIQSVREELHVEHGGAACRMGNSDGPGLRAGGRPEPGVFAESGFGSVRTAAVAAAGAFDGFWSAADWLGCRDGKWRPVEPGTFPLAHGLPARVGRLRGYGNAIVPQQAATFMQAVMEIAADFA